MLPDQEGRERWRREAEEDQEHAEWFGDHPARLLVALEALDAFDGMYAICQDAIDAWRDRAERAEAEVLRLKARRGQ